MAATCGTLMMFCPNEIDVLGIGHGQETVRKLQGSTPHDQLLIRTSDSFADSLFVPSSSPSVFSSSSSPSSQLPLFQVFFAKGCVLVHAAMALRRLCFELRLERTSRTSAPVSFSAISSSI
ncbi:uncharacterized protein LOC141837399 [Curcuma longa]|uniref:uncharacterized protein LOC141837399 n=1 Tax=Curcuma longa TaxID=136217 RepID=UPI003D9FA95B